MLLLNYDLQSLPPLHAAAGKGDVAEIARLLDLGADSEARADAATGYQDAAKRALTPLIVAAGSVFGSAAAVRALLKQGANPRALSGAGVDALWYAAGAGDPERTAVLLAMGGDPHAVSADGLSAVTQAARSGSVETLRLLLQEGASPHPPGGAQGYAIIEGERIPLFAAASSGSAACVQLLLEHGANAAARDNADRTALMHVAGPEVIPLLVAAGCPLNACASSGWNELQIALVDRNIVEHNARRAAPDVADTRVYEPDVQRRQLAVVAGLIDAGADLEACDRLGRTALLHACYYSAQPALIELLIARGADLHAIDADGRSALHVGCHKAELIRLLVRAGIPVNGLDHQGNTPLHLAVQRRYGGREEIDALLELGANLEARTHAGLTPLMLTAGRVEQPDILVVHLLDRGADPAACMPDGRTARDVAVEQIAQLETQLAAQSLPSEEPGRVAVAVAEHRLILRRVYAALASIDRALGYTAQPGLIQTPDLPESIWLGYRLQQQRSAAGYRDYYGAAVEQFEAICSFGHTSWMSESNAAACHVSEAAAHEFFLEGHDQPTEMYAYRAVPLIFGASSVPQSLEQAQLLGSRAAQPAEPDRTLYSQLGYDITECVLERGEQMGSWSGCSPLALGCNGLAPGMGSLVNRYCLANDMGTAYDMAIIFGARQPEPGPYLIVEVWRRRTNE